MKLPTNVCLVKGILTFVRLYQKKGLNQIDSSPFTLYLIRVKNLVKILNN